MKIGILGGTFDPIHLGHLRTAEEMGQELELDRVCMIPSALPPHKRIDPVTPFEHRLAMARLGIGDSGVLHVLDMEGKRPGPSYSVDTLRECSIMFGPGAELYFILGTDAFLEIHTWKSFQELFRYAHFVIIRRPGHPLEDMESFLSERHIAVKSLDAGHGVILETGIRLMQRESTLMDISSTRLRRMVKTRRSIRFLVPEAVRQYILDNGLYAA